ncbi:hypothetical protein [Marinospirillum sp.]|uniref:hypothetical protein n=1 Tax=Marinospirillum sp. TaxID=2183934 RepID=UPI00286FEDDE|nr:hypothetical protein [Marinospirillum sp.]MDR9468568.1 hypothetical protein [Marinospirillum sp.]
MDKKAYSLVALSVVSILLTGCLGDDSDSGSTGSGGSKTDLAAPTIESAREPVEITTASAPDAVKSAVGAMDGDNLDSLESLNLGDALAASGNKEKLVLWAKNKLESLGDWATTEKISAAATEIQSENCASGGSIEASVTDEGDYTQGSMKMTVHFKSCVGADFNANGSMSIYEAWTATTEEMEMVAKDLKIEASSSSFTMNGGMKEKCEEKADHDYCTSSSTGLEIIMGEKFFRLYSLNAETWDDYPYTSDWDNEEKYSLSLDASSLEGSLNLSTPQKLGYKYSIDDMPSNGQIKMEGANNTSLLVTFSADGSNPVAQVQVDTNNDGNYECDESGISQADLEAGNWSCSASGSAY